MRKHLNIKSIILENGIEIDVEQLSDKEDGIKFYVTDLVHDNFDILLGLRQTVPLNKIYVRTLKNKVYTLFNCFYTVRGSDELFIHLVFNEIVREKVDVRNFECNQLIVEFDCTDNLKSKEFSEDINFTADDVSIKHLINKNKYEVIISSSSIKNTEELFSYFADYFELINLIIGYFPTITKITYKLNSKAYIVENEVVNKYVTADEYRKRDLGFLNNLNNETFKNSYIKYRDFSKRALLQLSMYFMSTMKKKSYIEINVVNILQTLDGLYDKLTIFENKIEDYSKEMNDEIVDYIKTLDFKYINNKYNNDTNINDKITTMISRMNYISYRKKLKNMFRYGNYVIFKEERKSNNSPFIKYDTLIEKCVNSRNKFSHVDEKENYLFEDENVVYIHKLILIFRLMVLEEIGLDKEINMSYLNGHLMLVNDYIKRILSRKG